MINISDAYSDIKEKHAKLKRSYNENIIMLIATQVTIGKLNAHLKEMEDENLKLRQANNLLRKEVHSLKQGGCHAMKRKFGNLWAKYNKLLAHLSEHKIYVPVFYSDLEKCKP